MLMSQVRFCFLVAVVQLGQKSVVSQYLGPVLPVLSHVMVTAASQDTRKSSASYNHISSTYGICF